MLSRVAFLANFDLGYFRGIARGIATFAAAHARNAWIPMVVPPIDTTSILDNWKELHIIGVIACEGLGMDRAVDLGLPAVCVSGQMAKCPIPRVRSDDAAIGMIAADHLMSNGVRNFAYVSWSNAAYFSAMRFEGFCRRLRENGLADAQWLFAESLDEAGVRLRDWLSGLAKPVGILAASDTNAMPIIAACRELDLRIPDDVAVVGVDNDEAVCESTLPTLSSVPPETGKIGYEAAGTLMRIIAGDSTVPALTLIPPGPIVVRGSSNGLLMADPLVREAVEYLRRHFADRIKTQAVADAVCVCRKTLDARFKAALGCTPAQVLRDLQIGHAKRLLQTTDLSVTAVSKSAGFSSPRHFSQSFHYHSGMTPKEYRGRTALHG